MTDETAKPKTIAEWGDLKTAQSLLRFVTDDAVECRAGEGCTEGGDGLPAFAIHRVGIMGGTPMCATHSPFPNTFVPCTRCGVKPCEKPDSIEDDPMCLDCIKATLREVADRSMGEFTIVE